METVADCQPDWIDRFVEDGFVFLPSLADTGFCDSALLAIRRHLGDERPLEQWTSEAPGRRYDVVPQGEIAALDEVWLLPGLRAALDALFGEGEYRFAPPGERPHVSLWINPYEEAVPARLLPLGHVDSGDPYRGISVQIALTPTEPFGGNTSFFPGSHAEVHRFWRESGGGAQPGGNYVAVRRPRPPVEFVASAGDAVLCHHLTCHSGNPAHAPGRRPRIAMRFEIFSASQPHGGRLPPGDSGWARSYALER